MKEEAIGENGGAGESGDEGGSADEAGEAIFPVEEAVCRRSQHEQREQPAGAAEGSDEAHPPAQGRETLAEDALFRKRTGGGGHRNLPHNDESSCLAPLSPVLRGEGLGVRGETQGSVLVLTPHPQPLSPEYRGEGSGCSFCFPLRFSLFALYINRFHYRFEIVIDLCVPEPQYLQSLHFQELLTLDIMQLTA